SLYFTRPVRSPQQQRLDAALMESLNYGKADKAMQLLLQGADPNAHEAPFDEPSGFWERIKAYFHPRPTRSTALMYSCGQSPELKGVTRYLLDHGADVNAR